MFYTCNRNPYNDSYYSHCALTDFTIENSTGCIVVGGCVLNIYSLMELFCGKCDSNFPVRLTHAGPHIKALCGKCGAYIKFANLSTTIHYKESRAKIWAITKDLELITAAKLKCGVHEDLNGIDRSIAFQNLYSYIIKEHFT